MPVSKGRHPEDQGDWLVVVVTRCGWIKSPWKSYTKIFHSVDDLPSATQQLMEWWYSLPPDSYTRKVANVQLHWCSADENELTKKLRDGLYPPSNVQELLER